MKTHDYTLRSWGHDFTILNIVNGGKLLEVAGWGHGLVKGDYIILPNKAETTRYQIINIEYCLDPEDMWNATLSFAPRS